MRGWAAMLAGALCLGSAGAADAKPARCFTTDDGYYPCEFYATDRSGSFEIAADGKPTYILLIDQPGFATGFVNFGDRNILLPGSYVRSRDDGACWNNPETNTKICAW
jgi:hypothetical protein